MIPSHRQSLKLALFCIFCVFGTIVATEALLRIAEARLGLHQFDLFRRRYYENFYFHYLKEPRPKLPPSHFDPLLGWRNLPPFDPQGSEGMGINSEGWRATKTFEVDKKRERVALLGDSFFFGSNLRDEETTAHFLGQLIGPRYEVMNFAARGYGLDQMVLTGTMVLPRYQPDVVVLGFIAADLDRSCYSFAFHARKPHFEADKGDWHLAGVPVANPHDTWLEHQTPRAKHIDWLLTTLMRSRLFLLGAQGWLTPGFRHCQQDLNIVLLKQLAAAYPPPTKLLVVHLDLALPEPFETQANQLSFPYLSFPEEEAEYAKRWGLSPDRYPDRHPKSSLNELYAHFIYDALRAKNGVAKRRLETR